MLNRYHYARAATLNRWLDRLARPQGFKPCIHALEIGRLRKARETSGYSTLHIASHYSVVSLTSVDINAATEGVCREILPASVLPKIEFVTADATLWLPEMVSEAKRTWDFIYLDAARSETSELPRAYLVDCLGLTRPGTIIIVDDTGMPAPDERGPLVREYVKQHPKLLNVLEDIPRDRTSQGQMVLQANGGTS